MSREITEEVYCGYTQMLFLLNTLRGPLKAARCISSRAPSSERRAAGAVAHAGLCPTHVSVSFSPAVHQDRGHVCEDVRCAALDGKIN